MGFDSINDFKNSLSTFKKGEFQVLEVSKYLKNHTDSSKWQLFAPAHLQMRLFFDELGLPSSSFSAVSSKSGKAKMRSRLKIKNNKN